MKLSKTNIVILIVSVLVGFAIAGVGDKMNVLWQTQQQQQRAIRARALFQNIRNEIVNTNSEIQAIVDSGSFNLLDNEIKQSLQKAWQITKAAEVAFAADPNVVELLEWRP